MILYKDYNKIPSCPGVYRFYDINKTLIYVGKAKNLQKRVASYFKSNINNIKTIQLVKLIHFIDYIIVDSEKDALFLENNLIKENKPKYNILLKDNRSYPYIVITHDPYPSITITENLTGNNFFFGPFSNYDLMHQILDIIKITFQLRTCSYDLTDDNIANKKYKVCLKYHLGECSGVCEGKITKENYITQCNNVINFLNGNITTIKKKIKTLMLQNAKNMNYKIAQKYKKQLESIDEYNSKSITSNPKMQNFDVYYHEEDNEKKYCCYMIIKNGQIIFQNAYMINEDTI